MRAIVTGAASGIGRATAVRLAEIGKDASHASHLFLLDIAEEKLEETAAEIRATGTKVETYAGDLADEQTPEAAVNAAVASLGGLDLLVSNAGIVEHVPLTELTASQFDRAFAINVRATFLLAKAAHKALSESNGNIVVTASISGSQPTAGYGAYSASKAAVSMLVQHIAAEWAEDGIRCNAVSPGYVVTGMTEKRYSDPVVKAARELVTPLGSIGTAEQVANAVCFLAGPQANYITGVDLLVDGGLSTSLMQSAAKLL